MRLTIIGGWGGWPAPGGACSGYLLEHGGFRLLIDPGYAVLPKLMKSLAVDDIDAVLVSHGHPDHCADINPLLRVRRFMEAEPPPLPLFALPEALDPVLALDRPSMLGDSYRLEVFAAGESLSIGPFAIETRLLPHARPNAGFRLEVDGRSLVYTGDAAPSQELVDLATGTNLLLAEASYAGDLPADLVGSLSSARDVGREAAAAGADRLVLTHLLPGQDGSRASRAARAQFKGPVSVARAGLSFRIGG